MPRTKKCAPAYDKERLRIVLFVAIVLLVALAVICAYRSCAKDDSGETDETLIDLPTISDVQPTETSADADTGIPAETETIINIESETTIEIYVFDIDDVWPPDDDAPFVVVNDNVPFFTEDEIEEVTGESYGELDKLGRCTACIALVVPDLMPTEERGSIGSIKPSGWQTVKYDCVSGKYLYNRCHLIGYQLTAENANKKNLITGTRYLNIDGMLVFENMVADYVKETGLPVLYRSTPIFVGDELVARGVLMEGYSTADNGESIEYCVFCYNIQPGIIIEYADGGSCMK